MKNIKIFKRLFSFLKKLFINGLITILPIAATIFIVNFTYKVLSLWLIPIKQFIPIKYRYIPAIEFLLVAGLLLLIGIILKLIIIEPIVKRIEKLISKIPLIGTIYGAAKSLAHFFNVPSLSRSDKKVVLIQFPRKNFYNIAFKLDSAENDFQLLIPGNKDNTLKYYKVFMPNSPNPASGYFLILREDEIIDTDLTFEEAVKSVVSCGIVTPNSLKKRLANKK